MVGMEGRHLSWQRGPVEAAAAGGGSEPFTEVMNIKDKEEVQARRQSCSSSTASQKPDSYGWLQMELEWPQNSLSFLIAVIPIGFLCVGCADCDKYDLAPNRNNRYCAESDAVQRHQCQKDRRLQLEHVQPAVHKKKGRTLMQSNHNSDDALGALFWSED